MKKINFLLILVVFSFCILLVSSQKVSFVNSVNNVQYSNPSVQSIYGNTGYSQFWQGGIGDTFDESTCGEGTDFVLMIPPAGCEPMVVRSDLLAQQNVPVMCQLSSLRVNPLIKVSSIKTIGFSGQIPEEIAGAPSFYPARAGLRSYNTLLGDPLYNNVGYVTIILKRNPDESTMPKFVEGNLTARVTFDAEKAYGTGNAVLYLDGQEESEEESSDNIATFWNGMGYVKMLSYDSGRARLGVYTREGRLVREVVLKEGETSGKIYLPGYYCQASLKIKLAELTTPEDSARLNVDGEQIWVRKGSTILNGRCTVQELQLYTGDTGKVILSCKSAGRIELSLLGGYSAKLSSSETSFKVSDSVFKGGLSEDSELNWYLAYAGKVGSTADKDAVVVLLGSNKEIKPAVYSTVAQNVKTIIDREAVGENKDVASSVKKDLIVSGFAKETSLVVLRVGDEQDFFKGSESVKLKFEKLVGVDGTSEEESTSTGDTTSVPAEVNEYLKKADEAVKELLENYPQVRGDLDRFAEIALLEQINLVESAGDSGDKIELMETFLEKYPDSVYADLVSEMLFQGKTYDSRNAQTMFEINGDYYSVILNGFKAVDSEKKKANFYSNGAFLGTLSVGDEANLTLGKDEEKIRVSEIYPNRAVVELFVKKEKEFIRQGTITLRLNEMAEKKINEKDYRLEVSDIQVQTVAKVEIQADANNRVTEANFTYKIGIEQRTIKLNPNKSSEKAEKLNETIKKLEEKNNQLGELIKGWKAACLVTGMGLNIKNLVTGYSGESLARQEVMKFWRDFCEADRTTTSLGTQRSLDACYSANAGEIDTDVAAYTAAVKAVNERISKEQNITKFIAGLGDNSIDGLPGGASLKTSHLRTWDEVRAYLLYENIKGSSAHERVREYVKAQRNTKLQYLIGLKNEADAVSAVEGIGLTFAKDPQELTNREVRSWNREYLDTIKTAKPDVGGNPAVAGEQLVIGQATRFFILILDKKPTSSERARVSQIFEVTGGNAVEIKEGGEGDVHSRLSSYVYQLNDCTNKINSPRVTYYETGAVKGLAAMVPFDAERGWYVRVSSSVGGLVSSESKGYSSAAVPETFTICNVGSDNIQGIDDACNSVGVNQDLKNVKNVGGCILSTSELDVLVRDAQEALRQANRQYSSKDKIRIQVGSRKAIEATRGSPQAEDGPLEQCQDFMSPEDCSLMFNVCDPVMCPVSRCDFGGKYPVTNVIQSGIIGSLVLCLPNWKPFGGDVYVPICLTGVHAGIDAYISVLKAQRDCLMENARTGQYTGICDYMTAVYKCNLLWNQVSPFMSNLLPSLFSLATGTQKAGGGEYLTFQKSWNNMESSLDYFKNTYGSTSFTAFKLGNVEQFGTEICNAYVGTSFPTTAEGLDKMLQPESPYQVYAEFQEISHTDATVPPTSQYKVFAHIYAGNDRGVSYSVYLKSPPSSSYYASIPYMSVPRGTGFVAQGEQKQLSEDFTAPAGYKELCVSINGKEHCNFGPVTTDFGINLLNEAYVSKQAGQDQITTEKECIQGTSGVVGFTSINPQAAVENIVDPQIDLQGIVRVCSRVNPGDGTSKASNWDRVGYCGDQNVICWLDKSSVSETTGRIMDVAGSFSAVEESLDKINEARTLDEDQSMEKVIEVKNSVAGLKVTKTSTRENIGFEIEPILENIKKLEDKGYSSRYQAEGVYWRFKLYEQVVLKLLGKESDAKEVDLVDVPDASLPVEGDVAGEGSNEKTFGDLVEGNLIVRGGITYEVDRELDKSGTIGLKAQSGNQNVENIQVSSTNTISSKGYTWSSMNS